MGQHLTGSVGIVRGGAQRTAPGNTSGNQQTVIGLLSKIPSAQGGMQEQWTTLPPAVVDGICTPELGNAIWNFQSFWKAAGTFKNIDGVVDPGGNTLRVLNTLGVGGEAKKAGPNGLVPSNATNLNKLASAIRGEFPRASRWTLVNAPGINVGFTLIVGIGIGAGQLDVQDDATKSTKYLTYASGAAKMGWSPDDVPVTFSLSTRDPSFRSATSLPGLSGMGRIYTRQASLEFEDMTGPVAIFGITGAAPEKFLSDIAEAAGQRMLMGAAFNIFFLGITPSGQEALQRLPQAGNLFAALMNVARDCKAVCMSAGECVGFDLSIGFSIGYATGRFDQITAPKWVTDNQAAAKSAVDPYVSAYERGKKGVEDAIKDKLKDWNPF